MAVLHRILVLPVRRQTLDSIGSIASWVLQIEEGFRSQELRVIHRYLAIFNCLP
ncbi:uncharacterized protein CANTADRAFT_88044 [Suhomyces tanzawaensis NRRL Y-17324]|uniref:Uncharacterized protein n=1 Tax=Suhomyces tanzawaensis NRRL Y-17324 TaxID=984487 RepID=A0A1E4SRS7_9ASCO|nr:uncharacterized protein CANTADRAFT_88044 [Suhomyces tanzawaensis NRRL Y-17324]ODV82112.1 hypothetical protein CANTADRAFT_88044 [Suhomyces tanzawaensis NRRL Y-17324]